MRGRLTALGLAACIAGGCVGLIGDTDERASDVLGSATGTPVEPMMVRLTAPQMHNTYLALLGEPLALPDLPQDDQLYGLSSISAATKTVAPIEAEKYEAAAYFVLDQIWADPPRLEALVGCAPNIDEPCARAFLADFGKRAWRRPLSDVELDELIALGSDIATRLDDASQGLRFSLAAILQSPHFVFRVAIGEPDESGLLRFTGWEMASRLSYLIVDGPPDDALMEAAETGALLDPAGLRAEARRLVDSPAARPALVRFFRDFMNIGRLHQLDKDVELFPTFTATLGPSMQLEIERLFENVVFEKEGDFRQLFTTRDTYLNEELAAIYGIEGIEGPDFVPVTLPDDGTRAGLLTTPGFLAMNAHKTQTSPTHRGRFVRISLLCEDVPPPPPGVDTTLPDNAGEDKTMRERLSVHADDPACSSCHEKMDPIGFGLEHYDPLGAWRDLDNGLPIDAAADLDGVPFEGGVELAQLVAELPEVGSCIARRFYQHATTHLDGPKEQALVDGVIASFVASDYDFKTLVVEMVASGGFRYATAPATEDE